MNLFSYRTRVEFADTDAAGLLHFSNYFRFMERAEHAWFRHLGRSVMEKADQHVLSWPRVNATCSFRAPLRFEDECDIHVKVIRVGERSLRLKFLMYHATNGEQVAEGEVVAVCAEFKGGKMTSVSIPAELKSILTKFGNTEESMDE